MKFRDDDYEEQPIPLAHQAPMYQTARFYTVHTADIVRQMGNQFSNSIRAVMGSPPTIDTPNVPVPMQRKVKVCPFCHSELDADGECQNVECFMDMELVPLPEEEWKQDIPKKVPSDGIDWRYCG